jgi:xanthosine utilization system XapX-like protein
VIDLGALAGPSALLAAAATVVGAIFLGLFFSRGQPWGTLNDLASIVMMLATIPVALFIARSQADELPGAAWAVASIGIVGMLGATIAQALLVARVRSYEALLPWTLGCGAIVGVWYALVGLTGFSTGLPPFLALLGIASGVGYVAIGYGFWRGNERHPASVAGGVVLLVASTAFLVWVGIAAIAAEGLAAWT